MFQQQGMHLVDTIISILALVARVLLKLKIEYPTGYTLSQDSNLSICFCGSVSHFLKTSIFCFDLKMNSYQWFNTFSPSESISILMTIFKEITQR